MNEWKYEWKTTIHQFEEDDVVVLYDMVRGALEEGKVGVGSLLSNDHAIEDKPAHR